MYLNDSQTKQFLRSGKFLDYLCRNTPGYTGCHIQNILLSKIAKDDEEMDRLLGKCAEAIKSKEFVNYLKQFSGDEHQINRVRGMIINKILELKSDSKKGVAN